MSKNITIEGKKVKLDDRIITEFENFHKDSKSIYNEQNESLKSAFNIISVKNVEDVLRASDLFTKLNINILSNREKFLENCKSKPIENNFMIKDSSGWRIQSHYLGWGMNVDDLEKCVNYITRNSDIKDSSEYLKFRIKSRIDEAYENYLKNWKPKPVVEDEYFWMENKLVSDRPLPKDMFIHCIKKDSEFSEKWGLKIEERDLSREERYNLMSSKTGHSEANIALRKKINNFEGNISRVSYHEEWLDSFKIPTKLIKITYNNETLEIYE